MSDDRDDSSDEKVGYGKPPKATRFKKGESGNPAGRPKKPSSPMSLLNKALEQKVAVTEDGRRRKIPKVEVAIMQFANNLVRGDTKSLQLFLKIWPQLAAHVEKEEGARQRNVFDPKRLAALTVDELETAIALSNKLLGIDDDDIG